MGSTLAVRGPQAGDEHITEGTRQKTGAASMKSPFGRSAKGPDMPSNNTMTLRQEIDVAVAIVPA